MRDDFSFSVFRKSQIKSKIPSKMFDFKFEAEIL